MFLTKRATLIFDNSNQIIVEIGAGQGLVSIVTSIVLQKLNKTGRIYVTDGDESCLVQTQKNIDRYSDTRNSNDTRGTVISTTNTVRWGVEKDIQHFEAATWVFAADVVFENKDVNKEDIELQQNNLHAANHAFKALTKTFDDLIPTTTTTAAAGTTNESEGAALLLAYKRRRYNREVKFFALMKEKGFKKWNVKKRYVAHQYRNEFELICFDKNGKTCLQRLKQMVKEEKAVENENEL